MFTTIPSSRGQPEPPGPDDLVPTTVYVITQVLDHHVRVVGQQPTGRVDLSLITNVYLEGASVFNAFERVFGVIVKPEPTVPVSGVVHCACAPAVAARITNGFLSADSHTIPASPGSLRETGQLKV